MPGRRFCSAFPREIAAMDTNVNPPRRETWWERGNSLGLLVKFSGSRRRRLENEPRLVGRGIFRTGKNRGDRAGSYLTNRFASARERWLALDERSFRESKVVISKPISAELSIKGTRWNPCYSMVISDVPSIGLGGRTRCESIIDASATDSDRSGEIIRQVSPMPAVLIYGANQRAG